jgi:hypothetical protein
MIGSGIFGNSRFQEVRSFVCLLALNRFKEAALLLGSAFGSGSIALCLKLEREQKCRKRAWKLSIALSFLLVRGSPAVDSALLFQLISQT